MRIVIITQDDPFFLPQNIQYLIENLSADDQVVAAVVSDVSPYGKRESFFDKALKTLRIFGFRFFLNYACRYVLYKLILRRTVRNIFCSQNINILNIKDSINSIESLDLLREYKPDLIISIAGNEIFKRDLISLAKMGCINLHTGMLPKYRGLLPSFWAMKNNEKEIGVTVFFVDLGIDSGPIIVQRSVRIENKSQNALIRETKKLGMDCILSAIEVIKNGDGAPLANDDSKATYYSFPTKSDVSDFIRSGKRFF